MRRHAVYLSLCTPCCVVIPAQWWDCARPRSRGEHEDTPARAEAQRSRQSFTTAVKWSGRVGASSDPACPCWQGAAGGLQTVADGRRDRVRLFLGYTAGGLCTLLRDRVVVGARSDGVIAIAPQLADLPS